MNISNISPAIVPMEKIPSVETAIPPIAAPDKVDATLKTKRQTPEDNRQAAKAKEEENKNLSAKDLKQVAEEMNGIMDDLKTSLGFNIREEFNNLVVVEIKNRDTNELIKQIPAEEMLAIKGKMLELTGLLFDHSV